MRVADYIAQFLAAAGVQTVYMLSGTGSIFLDDAFAKSSSLRCICARHEAAAAVMASGAAKMSGGLGVVVVTTGPGGLNAIAGVAEAYVDSVPLIVISGQEDARYISGDERSFGVQGFPITRLSAGVTKHAALLMNPHEVPQELEYAAQLALSGRPGPVWLDIPFNVQEADINVLPPQRWAAIPDDQSGRLNVETAVDRIDSAVASARRPVLVIGGGFRRHGGRHSIVKLSELVGAPIVATRFAIDLLPYSEPNYMGLGGIRGRPVTGPILYGADLVLTLGTSLGAGFIGPECNALSANARVLSVRPDPPSRASEQQEQIEWLKCDAVAAVDGLLQRREGARAVPNRAWLRRCRDLKRSLPTISQDPLLDPINSYQFVEQLDAQSVYGDIFVSDAGGSYYATGQALQFERQQRDLTSGAFATMGVALPLAIGAASNDSRARALVVTGDGSIELNIQELRTIAEHNLNIKTFVINNGRYASIRDSQDAFCGGAYIETEEPFNFSAIAAAFGLPFHRIANAAAMRNDLAAILRRPGPMLVEVMCDPRQHMILPRPELLGAAA